MGVAPPGPCPKTRSRNHICRSGGLTSRLPEAPRDVCPGRASGYSFTVPAVILSSPTQFLEPDEHRQKREQRDHVERHDLFQVGPYWLKNWDMRTVSSATAGPAVSTTANRNSFQAHRNPNTPVPTSPGRASRQHDVEERSRKRLRPSSPAPPLRSRPGCCRRTLAARSRSATRRPCQQRCSSTGLGVGYQRLRQVKGRQDASDTLGNSSTPHRGPGSGAHRGMRKAEKPSAREGAPARMLFDAPCRRR